MKLIKVGMIAFGLTFSMLSFSQENNEKTPDERAKHQTERMSKELSLTPDQNAQVLKLNQNLELKVEEIRKDPNLNREQKQEKIAQIHETKSNELKLILNDEQYQKYLFYEKRRAEKKDMNQQIKSQNKSMKSLPSENQKTEEIKQN